MLGMRVFTFKFLTGASAIWHREYVHFRQMIYTIDQLRQYV